LIDSSGNIDGTEAVATSAPFPVNFPNLTADVYRIEITDAN